jgi:hypothetical protein
MSKMLAEPQSEIYDTIADGDELDVFTEAAALKSCMKFLASSANNMGLEETADVLLKAAQAVESDLRRHCN